MQDLIAYPSLKMMVEALIALQGKTYLDPDLTDELMRILGISMECESLGYGEQKGPYDRHVWKYDEWRCTIRAYGHTLVIPSFKMGIGNKGKEPTLYDIWACLMSDYSILFYGENGIVSWASDLGYKLDDAQDRRYTQQAYSATLKQSRKVQAFLTAILPSMPLLKGSVHLTFEDLVDTFGLIS